MSRWPNLMFPMMLMLLCVIWVAASPAKKVEAKTGQAAVAPQELSRRDAIAMHAMAALIQEDKAGSVAARAVRFADDLIAELDKKPQVAAREPESPFIALHDMPADVIRSWRERFKDLRLRGKPLGSDDGVRELMLNGEIPVRRTFFRDRPDELHDDGTLIELIGGSG